MQNAPVAYPSACFNKRRSLIQLWPTEAGTTSRIPGVHRSGDSSRTPATQDGDGPTKHKCPARPKPDGALVRDSSVTAGDSESATRSSGS